MLVNLGSKSPLPLFLYVRNVLWVHRLANDSNVFISSEKECTLVLNGGKIGMGLLGNMCLFFYLVSRG